MSASELNGDQVALTSAQSAAAPVSRIFSDNSDYEIATGLDKREESIRLATLRSTLGRKCLQIFLNLNLSAEDKVKIDKCLEALENYFKPSRSAVFEWYVFNMCVQSSGESVQS